MSTIVDATIPTSQFALDHTFERLENPEFEIVRLVESGEDAVMPFLWATADDLDALSDAVHEDPSTNNVETIAELDEGRLYRMEWTAQIQVVMYILLEESATVVDAHAANEAWYLKILFPEHDSVSATDEFCDEYDIDLQFERIYQVSENLRRGKFGLTEQQYEAVMTAFERGYYQVPRGNELAEVADERGVSHQALSEQIRRGHRNLIETALAPRPKGKSD